jgi:hypothetical protein
MNAEKQDDPYGRFHSIITNDKYNPKAITKRLNPLPIHLLAESSQRGLGLCQVVERRTELAADTLFVGVAL